MTSDGKVTFEIALSLAGVCLALGFWIRRKEIAARKWPQTSGVIVTSMTQRHYVGRGGEQEVPVIEYAFEYEGQPFKASHWRIGNYSSGRSESAQAITSRYAVGKPVTVFVNPRQPMKSVLEHGTSPLSWIPIGFGIGFVVLSLLPILLER